MHCHSAPAVPCSLEEPSWLGPFPEGTVSIPLSGPCLAQAHGDTRGQHEEGPAPHALGCTGGRSREQAEQALQNSQGSYRHRAQQISSQGGRSGRHALLPTLPSCCPQVPDSLPPLGSLVAPQCLYRSQKDLRGCAEPIRGWVLAATCPRSASVPGEPCRLEKGPGIAGRLHAGAQPHAHSPASTRQEPVLPCTGHFLFPAWGAAKTGSPSYAVGLRWGSDRSRLGEGQ